MAIMTWRWAYRRHASNLFLYDQLTVINQDRIDLYENLHPTLEVQTVFTKPVTLSCVCCAVTPY